MTAPTGTGMACANCLPDRVPACGWVGVEDVPQLEQHAEADPEGVYAPRVWLCWDCMRPVWDAATRGARAMPGQEVLFP
jgi:hypothetical protein